jgi:hypothetical protein
VQKGYLTSDEASYFYIDVPLQGVFHLLRNEKLRLSLFAGPSCNYLIEAWAETGVDVTRIRHRVELFLTGGVRFEFWHPGVDARFNYGVTTMSKNSSLRNIGFAEMIYYSFIDNK